MPQSRHRSRSATGRCSARSVGRRSPPRSRSSRRRRARRRCRNGSGWAGRRGRWRAAVASASATWCSTTPCRAWRSTPRPTRSAPTASGSGASRRGSSRSPRDISFSEPIRYTSHGLVMFNLIPREVRFFDEFERQSANIRRAADLLHDQIYDFADARPNAHAIKNVEHEGDAITHEIIKRLNTTFVTPLDREDIYALATRLDDVLDYIEAAAERRRRYRTKTPAPAARALADVIVRITNATHPAVKCPRARDPEYPRDNMGGNPLQNTAH